MITERTNNKSDFRIVTLKLTSHEKARMCECMLEAKRKVDGMSAKRKVSSTVYLMTSAELAAKYETTPAHVNAWAQQGKYDGVKINGIAYYPRNVEPMVAKLTNDARHYKLTIDAVMHLLNTTKRWIGRWVNGGTLRREWINGKYLYHTKDVDKLRRERAKNNEQQ